VAEGQRVEKKDQIETERHVIIEVVGRAAIKPVKSLKNVMVQIFKQLLRVTGLQKRNQSVHARKK
jgi:hypothetical protein